MVLMLWITSEAAGSLRRRRAQHTAVTPKGLRGPLNRWLELSARPVGSGRRALAFWGVQQIEKTTHRSLFDAEGRGGNRIRIELRIDTAEFFGHACAVDRRVDRAGRVQDIDAFPIAVVLGGDPAREIFRIELVELCVRNELDLA